MTSNLMKNMSCLDYLCCCFGGMRRKGHVIRDDDDIPTAETAPLLNGTSAISMESYGGGRYYTHDGPISTSLNRTSTKKKKHKRRWNSASVTPDTEKAKHVPDSTKPRYKRPVVIKSVGPPTFETLYQKIVHETEASMIDISNGRPSNETLCSSSSKEYVCRVNHYLFALRNVSQSIITSVSILLSDIDGKYDKPFDEGVPISADDIQLMDESLDEIASAMDDFKVHTTDEIVVDFPMPVTTIMLSNENQTMESL